MERMEGMIIPTALYGSEIVAESQEKEANRSAKYEVIRSACGGLYKKMSWAG